ncbi:MULTISPECIES: aspartate/glutamate racemase family protein [Flavobacterium]|jgi:aspartate racemase|uniref:Aspartate racemase n=1 Tax=Flavobacterium salmonis TaxID=2654844 RepID=A0A6V6YN28_9FLAO|nr:amino acid racemase [Flavobacterium salmonis]CAD0000865.1 aspartate racemase [Flavobacterium salmonis]
MKRIALIGGVGPESTIEYYRLIIKRFQERLNTKDYPEIIINSINMTEMLNCLFNNQLDDLANLLIEKIKILEKSEVDYVAIASNTPHIVFDNLADKVKVSLISIVEETCKVINDKKIQRVGLLGTKFTMTSGFYNKVAEKYEIEIIIPDSIDQDFIHDKYMTELLINKIVPETKKQLIQIVRTLKEKKSIEAVVLAGTELPLILNQSDFDDIEILDTTKIHVESIVSRMIEN